MKEIFKNEFHGIFGRAWSYLGVAIMLLVSSVTFIYYNLSHATENILSVLSVMAIASALILPLFAVAPVFHRTEENGQYNSYQAVLGKYFAALLAVLLSNIPLLMLGALSGMYASADHIASYSALIGFVFFEAALLAFYSLLARRARTRVRAYIFCYSAALLWYFVPMLGVLLPLSPPASLLAFALTALLASLCVFIFTRKPLLSLVFFAAAEGSLVLFYLVFKESFTGLFERVLRALSVFGQYNSFSYGIFSIGALIFFTLCAVICLLFACSETSSNVSQSKYPHTLSCIASALLLFFVLFSAFAAAPGNGFLSFDATLSKKNTPSAQASAYISTLEKDVSLYLLEPTGDESLELYLEGLAASSEHIHLSFIYGEVTPEFYSDRGIATDKISANSIVIECAERVYYISYHSLFYYSNSELGLYKMSRTQYEEYLSAFSENEQYENYLSSLYYNTSVYFAADEAICSYIEYAVADILPANYYLCGHGEKGVDDESSPYYGLGLRPLAIGDEGQIPDDAASIFINMPTADISESERQILSAYLARGGQLTFVTDTAFLSLPNFTALLAEYGLSAEAESVKQRETDAEESTTLLPTVNTKSDVLEYFGDDSGFAPLVRKANAIKFDEDARPYLTLTPLLSSPEGCYVSNPEVTATYTLACSAETPAGARIVWFTGGDGFGGESEDSAEAVMCALGWVSLKFESETGNLPAALYSIPITPITALSALVLSAVLVLLPLAVLAVGHWRIRKRRK